MLTGTRTQLTRRQALVAGACFCCVRASAQQAAHATRAFVTDEVAPGIHIRRGLDEDVTAQNEDAIANIGFVVGRNAVAVIDPGGSLIDGERLRAAIRQTTPLLIKYVVMSHIHPDHIFGAPAFQKDRPQFVGHARLPRALALRAEFYRKRLEDALGKQCAGGAVAPTMRRPENLAAGAPWLPLPHRAIPGSLWIPGVGLGEIPPAVDGFFRQRLAAATGGSLTRRLVIYCHKTCWLSWNAAKRAISYGYRNVYWFRDGIEGWKAAGYPTAIIEPQSSG
ncbi:MAG: MBL fold metallo-hydrolase [Steroidobacteraceae bacterium]